MSPVHSTIDNGVAVIRLDNPPVNGLGQALRIGFMQALGAAAADAAVKAIVITGTDRNFSGGADIKEFGTPRSYASPNLLDMIAAVESSAKPVVAAINGTAMGGGLELALGAHGRVALDKAFIALPEVKLGLIPGAGGTQRLPRALGLAMACNIIISGEPFPARMFAGTGLFNAVVKDDVVGAAVKLALELAASGQRPKVRDRALDLPVSEAQGFLQYAKGAAQAQFPREPARALAVDAIGGVLKPFDEGMAEERKTFINLMSTPVSMAMRHVFAAERAASRIADIPADTPTSTIARVGVIGAGTMGGGIAMNFLNAGIPVTIIETKQDALDRGLKTIRGNYENSARKGRITAADVETRMGLLTPALDMAALKDADLIIEAVFENMDVKQDVFSKLDTIAKPGAILASNTSTLDVNKIASFTRRPQDVLGMHFFSPANVMKLLEVVRGAKTGKDVLATVMQLAKKIKKIAVVSGVCDGFIGNRMLEYYRRMSGYLLEKGAAPEQIDKALEKFGLAMGPFRMGDLAGNDIGWAVRKHRYAQGATIPFSELSDRLCEMGRYGQKTGAGWYRYEPGNRNPLTDPVVAKLISDYRHEKGINARKFSETEIVERCMYALVNEGAKILEEGIAQRASDVDMTYIAGYGFPAWRGGPMFWADQQGLFNVVARMKEFAAQSAEDADFWQPAPLLARLAAEGKSFNAA
ncbi:MAG: enoyl-CoA hydratase/isomerase family protein [Hyphomicrobiales bacterium]|nr:enoyl-CoA hydratase/isomerase family protein [Hyphomicrobiales bacterium]